VADDQFDVRLPDAALRSADDCVTRHHGATSGASAGQLLRRKSS
jgi:hypothetical protein